MNEPRDHEELLRRALRDAAEHLPPRTSEAEAVPQRTGPSREWRRLLVGALAALLLVATIPVGIALLSSTGGSAHKDPAHDTSGLQQVLQALAATVGSGSYDLDTTFHAQPATQGSAPCTDGRDALCQYGPSVAVDVAGHGTVNTNPYAMTVVTNVSDLGPVTLFVNDTSVWEFGGAGYGTNGAQDASAPAPQGSSLSGFSTLVEGTFGPGQGALTMLSIANNTGYLGLESEMVKDATTDGNGTLDDGAAVTYYQVDIDLTKMADAAGLSSEQRQAINDAVTTLQHNGYSSTKERVAVDEAGLIREVDATTTFVDGGSMTRRTLFSNFGCAAQVSMPNQPSDTTPTGTCTTNTSTTTTSSPPTTSAPTSTTPPEPTTTTADTVAPTTTTTSAAPTATLDTPPANN